jgi:hypothetical protein
MTTRAYTSRAAAILLAVAGAAGAASANDALIAYEGFNYGATANLAGANGGTGWGSAWFKLSDIPTGVTLEGLSWPGLPTSGGSAFTAGYPSSGYTRYSRVLDTYVAPNDEVYVSFLFRPNVGYGVGGGLAFGTWENGMIVGIIPGSGQYGLSGLPGTPASETTTPVVQDETVLLVARVTKEPGDMIMWSLFVNPSIGEIAPVTPDATLAIPGTALPPALFLYNDGDFSTDEIRLGAT